MSALPPNGAPASTPEPLTGLADTETVVESTPMRIVRDMVPRSEIRALAAAQFGDMVKAVVDVRRGVIAIGGELHADEESLLLDDGSQQIDLWGINLYPDAAVDEWIVYDSMINVRPSLGNRSRDVQDETVRQSIQQIVDSLVGQ